MPKNNSINGIHAQRLREIRKFVEFDYDLRKPLSNYQKRKIKKYYDAIDNLTSRPNKIYRPRRRDRLKAAQDYSQHPPGFRDLKVAFVPAPSEDAKITFTKSGEMRLKTKHVTTADIDFDIFALIENPKNHVKEKTDEHPKAKAFTLKAAEHEIPRSYSRALLHEGVIALMEKYGNEDKNNYFGNWMFGAKAHYFTNQDDFMSYQKEKEQKRNELKRKRRAARQRKKRKS